MHDTVSKCIRVSDSKICPHCYSQKIVKNGKTGTGKQQYVCRCCGKRALDYYTYKAYRSLTNEVIIRLTKEGCGIRSISRLLKIGVNTVLRRIKAIALKITKPNICFGKEYELDELCTYVKNKSRKCWIAYAIRKDTRQVVDFSIGGRTNNTLRKVTDKLILSNATKIFTDKLPNYRSLLPSNIHSTKYRGTNHIERKNLTLRTHLKRLSRRTICFSKSAAMLSACLKIYFWG